MLLEEHTWEQLIDRISDKKCVPVAGVGTIAQWLPMDAMAGEWTEKYGYPFDDSPQLSKVAQYLGTAKGDEIFPKKYLSREIYKTELPDFTLNEFRNTPPVVLADLDLPFYITTNYDHLIERALIQRGKAPVSEVCRWNGYINQEMWL